MSDDRTPPADPNGFTLIEIAIVLVIVGLIIAGIVAGRTLIRQSQVNSVMADEQRYIAAATQFQSKYSVLPGDMPTATNYWGAMTTCPPTPGGAGAGGTLTCNGNGDGQINVGYEMLYFWQHLANAQFIPGNYTGVSGSGSTWQCVLGSNCPASRVEGAMFGISYQPVTSANAFWYDAPLGHYIYFGASTAGAPYTAIITTAEALHLDTKYDDGLPATGNVRTYKSTVLPSCATTDVAATAAYKTAASGLQCSLIFITGF